jgi:hypothetical protein
MRERMFLIAYRRELERRVTFPDPTHWLVLPPGYEGSRAVAIKVLNGLLGRADDYIEPSVANPKLPPAVTAEEAIGDLPPIYSRQQIATGDLRRGARRFDEELLYDRRRKVSSYARLMRTWPGFEAPLGLKDHVIRYLPRDGRGDRQQVRHVRCRGHLADLSSMNMGRIEDRLLLRKFREPLGDENALARQTSRWFPAGAHGERCCHRRGAA